MEVGRVEKSFSRLFKRKESVQIQRRNRFVIGRGSIRHWLCVWSSGISHHRSISVLGGMCLLSKGPDKSPFFALRATHCYFTMQSNRNLKNLSRSGNGTERELNRWLGKVSGKGLLIRILNNPFSSFHTWTTSKSKEQSPRMS